MEVLSSENGLNITYLSPMFLEEHIEEMIEKVQEGLTIYKNLNDVAPEEQDAFIVHIIAIIRKSNGVEEAKTMLFEQLNISESTARYFMDMSLEELTSYMVDENKWKFAFYKTAYESLSSLAENLRKFNMENCK
ncbi:MAG: hypothetical protein MJZ03_06795 [archaeon]|nr:hypothetical protein [archaeon]